MLKLAVPLIHVSNSATAEEFYCGRLGFRREFAHRVDEAAELKPGSEIYLIPKIGGG